MSALETFYLWMAAAFVLAFIAGFSCGVWTTLHIIRRWRRQWEHDHGWRRKWQPNYEEPVVPEYQAQETPTPTVLRSNDSFERP